MIKVIERCDKCPCLAHTGGRAGVPLCKLNRQSVFLVKNGDPFPANCPLRKENVLLTIGEINESSSPND